MEYNEDDIFLCKVNKIEGTTVFLDVEGGGKGTMVLSEVAAGRIRNLRDYVSPGREVVCKVLRVYTDHIELSLRRVTAGERDEIFERNKRERAFRNVLKVIGEDADKVINEIKYKYDLIDFLDEAIDGKNVFEEFLSKDKAKKVFEIFSEKEGKEKFVDARFVLRSDAENGVEDIKEILDVKECKISYLGSSRFSIRVSAGDFKTADDVLKNILAEIENRAKSRKAVFEVVKK